MNTDPECVSKADASHIRPETAEDARRSAPRLQLCGSVLVWHKTEPGLCLGVSRKWDPSKPIPTELRFAMPGGKVDPEDWHGVDPERASRHGAIRELHEETGIVVLPEHLSRIYGTRTYRDGVKNGRFVTLYLAKEWSGEIYTVEPHAVRWVTPAELEAGPFGDVYTYAFDLLGVRVGRLS